MSADSAGSGPAFERYIGIDYSGAKTPVSSLKGLRVYSAGRAGPATEVPPPLNPKKYWTRREIAEWLVQVLHSDTPTLVGIDHGFSFPYRYFLKYELALDWTEFLDDFQHHWPTDENIYVDFVRDGTCGNGAARTGDSKWRRITEIRARGAKSVFHFDVPGSVAKSTYSGLPWLRCIRKLTAGRVHFWPFDGWEIPTGRSAIAEVYPALCNKTSPQNARDEHQHDAYSIAEWLRRADGEGQGDGQGGGSGISVLGACLRPELDPGERKAAEIEGWILGVL